MDKPDIGRKIDFTNCNKNIWLVKVPKYIADSWDVCDDNEGVGMLTINKNKQINNNSNQNMNKPEITFTLNSKFSNKLYNDISASSISNLKLDNSFSVNPNKQEQGGTRDDPTMHKVLLNPVPNNTMFMYSQTQVGNENNETKINKEPSTNSKQFKMFSDQKDVMPMLFSIDGKITQRGEIQPLSSSKQYMKLKKVQFAQKNQPIHFVQKLERHVQNYKPVSDHSKFTKNDLLGSSSLSKGGSGPSSFGGSGDSKKLRLDKDRVMEVLFRAFEKHQYYSIKDLVRISDQPVTYLKEVLKEICNYNLKNPYRNMWELKPEYRHYAPTTKQP